MLHLTTPRLVLVAADLALARADWHDRAEFGRLLGAEIPAPWPPPENDDGSMSWFVQSLEADPAAVGWCVWYFLLPLPDGTRLAVGNGGFKGRPSSDGIVEVGYSIIEARQRIDGLLDAGSFE